MPGPTYHADQAGDTTLVTTAETVVATLGGVSVQRAGQQVRLRGEFTVTTGTGTTALTPRIRRDALAGTLVGEAIAEQVEAVAGSTETHEYTQTDSPGDIAGATYVLTVAQAAATGNGTVTHASLSADIIG